MHLYNSILFFSLVVPRSMPPLQLLDLPDEVLVLIATTLPLRDFVHFQSTNQKLRHHLSQLAVFQKLITIRNIQAPYLAMMKSLEYLYYYEQVDATGLLQENRIGFDFGTATIMSDEVDDDDSNDERDETDIQGSYARMDRIKDVLRKHPRLSMIMDAHCGTAAPDHEIANVFSVHRGYAVLEVFGEFISETPDLTRLTMRAWGKRIAEAASATTTTNNHPYSALAREGKGWVELRISLMEDSNGEFIVPALPSFYDGVEPENMDDWHMEEHSDGEDFDDPDGYDREVIMDDSDDDDDDAEGDGENEMIGG